ncbi:hypothetical protein BZA77DRAFT_372432, partial [Pyronema omphalodes]
SDNASPSYVPNPSSRGTLDLLLTSIITLMLCVYTSIHLNIAADSYIFFITIPRLRLFSRRKKPEDTPGSNSDNAKEPYGIGVKRATVYKFYWVIIALFAPEFVLFAALNQWQEARALRKTLREVVIKSDDGMEDAAIKSEEQIRERMYLDLLKPTLPLPVGKADWSKVSMTSAFFVIMGGYAYRRGYDFKILESDLKFPYISLTPAGFLELARKGVLHPGILDDKAIADRSKADWLAKLLVCAQALWMVFNVIGRKASGLPSTLIELNVIVHVVVMVVVYGLWWNKPLAVQNPVILNPTPELNDGHTKMLSVLISSKRTDSQVSKLCYKIVTLHEDDFPLTMISWTSEEDYLDDNTKTRRSMFKYKHPLLFWFYRRFSCNWGNYRNSPISVMTAEEHHQRYSDISFPEGLGWNYHVATEKTSKSDKGKGKETIGTAVTHTLINGENCSKGLRLQPGEVLLLVKKNTHDHKKAVVTPPVFISGATILSLIYAGCHATAWNSHFPSFTERYLWRIACIFIAAGGPILLVLIAVYHVVDSFVSFLEDHVFHCRIYEIIPDLPRVSVLIAFWVLPRGCILLYTSSRIFIIVEAFISMRSLPAGAYDSVDWIEIIPHV